MSTLSRHPTVLAFQQRAARPSPAPMRAGELRRLCLDCGADDVGFVSLARTELDPQREEIRQAFPATRWLISIVCRMNRESIRATERSIANLEFHQTTDHVNEVCQKIVRRLEEQGIGALNTAAGFPMDMTRFPGKVWLVSHKPVAVAAGLGMMGIHRNVIHPKFGNFILLGTVLIAADVDEESEPLDYNPCLSCKLCVAACPVGAIKADGRFDPSACLTHNYREFMGGFTGWVHNIADSRNAADYRKRVADTETASMWQSLSFGANYKAAYCLSACPAGEDVIAPFLADKQQFVSSVVRPLQEKRETIYVVPGSDAAEYVPRRFPHKRVKHVRGVAVNSIAGLIAGMPIVFQEGRSKGMNLTIHFTFTGSEQAVATVTIREQRLTVEPRLVGEADCRVTADADTWLGFLRKERNLIWAIIRGKIRVRGRLSALQQFGKCFPS